MRQPGFLNYIPIILLALISGGCLSVSDSPAPRFYTLSAPANTDGLKKYDLAAEAIIGIGPIEIPEYQNRPQMVTRNKDGRLKFAQFERWGEALDAGLARLIVENLTLILPKADFQIFPCNFAIPLNYQVIISIVQLDSQLDKNVFLIAQWTIIDTKTKAMLLTKRTQINQPVDPHNYTGLVQALSEAAALLSEEIAENLSKLSFKSATKDTPAQ